MVVQSHRSLSPGPIFIEKITGKKLHALQRPNAPLIEFIGNSITCGAAADPSEVPCDAGVYHDQHNAYAAYGPRVARAPKYKFYSQQRKRHWNLSQLEHRWTNNARGL